MTTTALLCIYVNIVYTQTRSGAVFCCVLFGFDLFPDIDLFIIRDSAPRNQGIQ